MENAPEEPLVLARAGHFFAGGAYVETAEGRVLSGHMYVRELVPARVTRPHPVVMIHGLGQTGTNFEATPDGREGWAQNFVRDGYAVYVVDQPTRGRSAHHPDIEGPAPRTFVGTAEGMAHRFTSPGAYGTFARAERHTQWPGSGAAGDPVFEQFMAAQVPSIPTATARPEQLTRDATAALLDRIGPAVLLTHSQSGAFGWQIADVRPRHVKAIVAIEPALGPTIPASGSATPPYGIAMNKLRFEPPLDGPDDLVHVVEDERDEPDLARCWLQGDPVRRLPNLAGIPIAIVVAEASPQALTSHCIAKFLAQAGVANDFIRLEAAGIRGNGHMMMLERNSAQIAGLLVEWLTGRGL